MEIVNTQVQSLKNSKVYQASLVFLGSVIIALTAQLSLPLPFTPVPVILHDLAICLLALSLGARLASAAVVAYLVQASLGLPVLAGAKVMPLWILSPTAGYLLAFVPMAYFVGSCLNQKASKLKTFIVLSLAHLGLLLSGTAVLSLHIGAAPAFYLGFLPFLIGAGLKVGAATFAQPLAAWLKAKA